MKIYDRKKQSFYEERQYGGSLLKFLYQNAFGRLLLKIVIHPFFSKCAAYYYRSSFSKKKIISFIENYRIEMEAYEDKEYQSFYDFFIRKLKEEELEKKKRLMEKIDSEEIVISPAHSKLCVYSISSNLLFSVKNSIYSLEELLEDTQLAKQFEGGTALVFRLSVSDYHRYAFVQSGEIKQYHKIRGSLHTVSSFSSEYRVYVRNSREYMVIGGKNHSDMIQMEIGAILVGKIHNHGVQHAIKGEEKGYFEFGGSTIILLFKKEEVQIDEDILEMSKKGLEVKVDYLEKIGYFK